MKRNVHHLAACIIAYMLTHWGRVTHICVSKQTIIGSDNGLSPGRCQAIIWTNAAILLIGPLGTNFSEILIEILAFSFKKMRLKMASAKWRPSCLGLNVLIPTHIPNEFTDLISCANRHLVEPCLPAKMIHNLFGVENNVIFNINSSQILIIINALIWILLVLGKAWSSTEHKDPKYSWPMWQPTPLLSNLSSRTSL